MYSIAEAEKYVSHNYEPLRNQLQVKLGLVPQFKQDILDAGGAPVFVPQGLGPVAIAPDGTISTGGQPVGQLGLVMPTDPAGLTRQGGVMFEARGGFEPVQNGKMLQGFLEASNVNPTLQIARMIEVQRAYELGQNFLQQEDERIRGVIQAMGR